MKKNDNITIITAYFDVGRGNYNKEFSRDNNKYISFFKFWARIQNPMVIYTEPQFEDSIKKVRDSFGLANKTKIIIIDEKYKLYADLFEKSCEIENNNNYKNFRYVKNVPDNLAAYDYIMFLKSWCMKNAYENNYIKTTNCAWIDFGLNHGGRFFENEKDFDFLWEYPLKNKIYVASLKKDDNMPIFQIIQSGEVYIQGGIYMMPTCLIMDYYNLIYEAYNSLLDLGFIDDDQILLLMAYRKKKDLFVLENCECYELLRRYGASHMKLKEKKETTMNVIEKIIYKYRVCKRNFNYLKGLKKIFLKDYLD